MLSIFVPWFSHDFSSHPGLGGRRFRGFGGDSKHRQRLRRAVGPRAMATVLHLDEGRGPAEAHGVWQQRQLCGDTERGVFRGVWWSPWGPLYGATGITVTSTGMIFQLQHSLFGWFIASIKSTMTWGWFMKFAFSVHLSICNSSSVGVQYGWTWNFSIMF